MSGSSNFAVDLIILLVLAGLVYAAVRSMKKHGSCSADCSQCASSCSKRKDAHPSFVEAYRKDHLKNQS